MIIPLTYILKSQIPSKKINYSFLRKLNTGIRNRRSFPVSNIFVKLPTSEMLIHFSKNLKILQTLRLLFYCPWYNKPVDELNNIYFCVCLLPCNLIDLCSSSLAMIQNSQTVSTLPLAAWLTKASKPWMFPPGICDIFWNTHGKF